ncbi:hypothetical protein TorRG33x02_118800, partial [Trema orientale]
ISVLDSGDDVLSEPQIGALDQVPDQNLAVGQVHVVWVDVDQERRVGVMQELEQGADHVADGDGGDLGSWEEQDHLLVEPLEGVGAVGRHGEFLIFY